MQISATKISYRHFKHPTYLIELLEEGIFCKVEGTGTSYHRAKEWEVDEGDNIRD